VKSRPILFSKPMILALLAGTKSQTRRVANPQPEIVDRNGRWYRMPSGGQALNCYECPYGAPGDGLWVREAHAIVGTVDPGWILYRASGYESECRRHGFDAPPPESTISWRPSIHMPRWASRIALVITSVHIERLQSISAADAIAEGIERPESADEISAPDAFRELWQSINGADSWAANPWVWAVSFKRVTS
jgi:hypothetical protein